MTVRCLPHRANQNDSSVSTWWIRCACCPVDFGVQWYFVRVASSGTVSKCGVCGKSVGFRQRSTNIFAQSHCRANFGVPCRLLATRGAVRMSIEALILILAMTFAIGFVVDLCLPRA